MNFLRRKPVSMVSYKARPFSLETKTNKNKIALSASFDIIDIIISKKQITKMLIRL